MVEHRTYPIPSGYRRLDSLELIVPTDLAWTETGAETGEFRVIGLEDTYLVGKKAGRALCIIRLVEEEHGK